MLQLRHPSGRSRRRSNRWSSTIFRSRGTPWTLSRSSGVTQAPMGEHGLEERGHLSHQDCAPSGADRSAAGIQLRQRSGRARTPHPRDALASACQSTARWKAPHLGAPRAEGTGRSAGRLERAL